MEDSYDMLGLAPEADGANVAAAYWRRAREIAGRRAFSPKDATELECVNRAYEAISGELHTSQHRRLPDRPSRPRRSAVGTRRSAGCKS